MSKSKTRRKSKQRAQAALKAALSGADNNGAQQPSGGNQPKKKKKRAAPGGQDGSPHASRPDPKAHRHHRIARQLNRRLAIGSLIALIVVAPSVYFLHQFQVRRTSAAFLVRADELTKEQEWIKAAEYVQRYLRLHPTDSVQRIRLAELFDKAVDDDPALIFPTMRVFRTAISAASGVPKKQIQLRRSLCDLLIKTGQFRKAELTILEQPADVSTSANGRHLPLDPADCRIVALALYGRFTQGAVTGPFTLAWPAAKPNAWSKEIWTLGKLLEVAVKRNPADRQLSLSLAVLLRENPGMLSPEQAELSVLERADLADSLVDKVVAAAPDDIETLLTAYNYGARYERATADRLLDHALTLAPGNPQVLIAAARRARVQAARLSGDAITERARTTPTVENSDSSDALDERIAKRLRESEAYYRKAIEADQTVDAAFVELGDLLRQRGRLDEAIDVWLSGIKHIQKSPKLLVMLVDGLLSASRLDSADRHLDQLRQVAANSNPLRLTQNELFDLQRTVALLEGKRWLLAENFAKALEHLRQVLPGLTNRPLHRQMAYEANVMMAQAYTRLQLWDLAAQHHETIAELGISRTALRHHLAAAECWRRAGRPRRAAVHYHLALNQRDDPAIWLALAQVIFEQNALRPPAEHNWSGFDDAIANTRRGLDKLKPETARRIESMAALTQLRASWVRQAPARRGDERRALADQITRKVDQLATSDARKEDIEFWREAARMYVMLGDAERAAAAAAKVRELAEKTDTPEAGVAFEAQILVRIKRADQARQILLQAITGADDAAKATLRQVLASVEAVAQQSTAGASPAESLTPEAADAQKLPVPALLQLAERDLARRSPRTLQWLERIKRLEGEQGTTWKYIQGRWLIVDLAKNPPKKNDPRLSRLVEIANQLEEERPYWSATHLLAGMVAQARQRPDDAIEAYRLAIDLGERRIFVFEQLAKLMWATGRPGVETVLARLGNRVSVDPELSVISILSATRGDDLNTALARAAEAVRRRPKDPMAYLWYGQILLLQERESEAESQLVKATEVAPRNIRAWTSLIGFYVQRGAMEKARATAKRLEAQVDFESETQKEYVMAQIERVLGQPESAAKRLDRAVELAKNSTVKVSVLIQAARLDIGQGNLDDAIAKLRRAVQLVPSHGEARRFLAAALASRGEGEDYDQALDLLQGGEASTGDDVLDRRLRGLLLARRADLAYRDNVAAAEQIYRRLVEELKNPADQFFLANLLFTRAQLQPAGRPTPDQARKIRADLMKEADALFQTLVRRDEARVEHVAHYLGFLLMQGERERALSILPRLRKAVIGDQNQLPARLARYARILLDLQFDDQAEAVIGEVDRLLVRLNDQANLEDWAQAVRVHLQRNRPDAATRWLAQMEKHHPDAVTTLELRLKWQKASGMQDTGTIIDRFAERFLADPKNAARKAYLYQSLAVLCAQIEWHDDSEKWARRLYELNRNSYKILVTSLAMQHRYDEGLEVCRDAAAVAGLPRTVATMATLLTQQETLDLKQLADTEPLIRQALDEAPDDTALLTAVGTLRAKQQRVDQAVALYRKVLEIQPRNVVVLNNLATLLAEVPDRVSEAIRYADYALLFAGVNAALLDTKGTALLRARRYAEAVEILEMAVRSPTRDHDPRYAFHLAVALWHLNQRDRARQLLDQAIAHDLEKQLLTPADREDLRSLKNE